MNRKQFEIGYFTGTPSEQTNTKNENYAKTTNSFRTYQPKAISV